MVTLIPEETGNQKLEALDRLRERLLDLSLRNRLLNFQDRGAKMIRIIDELPDQVYAYLVDKGKSMVLEPLPATDYADEEQAPAEAGAASVPPSHADPTAINGLIGPADGCDRISRVVHANLYEAVQRVHAADADDHDEEAADAADETSTLPDIDVHNPRHYDDALQTTLTAEQLEGRLQRIHSDYQSHIESTGSNLLFLAIGFLEWRDPDRDPDKPRLAPLILVPIQLERSLEALPPSIPTGGTNGYSRPGSPPRRCTGRVYRYRIRHSGEEPATNLTLALKLRRSPFNVEFPRLGEDDLATPNAYLDEVRAFLDTWSPPGGERWRVLPQMRIGFFTYAKDVMYRDLDPANWNLGSLVEKPQVAIALEGCERPAHDEIPYLQVEEHQRDSTIPTVLDADSSQMRVLIRAARGDDLVVQGPPGTGKSQTITNLIAAAMAQGKRVLFVAEKLAALEVVRSRLEKAGLGAYCLELHSRSASITQVHSQIRRRLGQNPAHRGQDAAGILGEVNRNRDRLNGHSSLMAQRIPELDCCLSELFWKADASKQRLVEAVAAAGGSAEGWPVPPARRVGLPDQEEFRILRQALETVRIHWSEGIPQTGAVWEGLKAECLTQDNVCQIERILDEAIDVLRNWIRYQSSLQEMADLAERSPDQVRELVAALSEPPPNLLAHIATALATGRYSAEDYRTYLNDLVTWQSHANSPTAQIAERIDLSDTHLEEVDDALQTLLALSDEGGHHVEGTRRQIADIDDLQERLERRRMATARLVTALGLTTPPETFEGQAELADWVERLCALDDEFVETIEPFHVQPGIDRYWNQAQTMDTELRERRVRLARLYVVEDAPSAEALAELRKDLRELGDSWIGWWPFGRLARARRQAQRFSRSGVCVTAPEFIDGLVDLGQLPGDEAAFAVNANLCRHLGRAFNGRATDWELLERCLQFARELRNWLRCEATAREVIGRLGKVTAHRASLEEQIAALRSAGDGLEALAPAGALGPGTEVFARSRHTHLSEQMQGHRRILQHAADRIGLLGVDWTAPYIDLRAHVETARVLRAVRRRMEMQTQDPGFLGATPPDVSRADAAEIRQSLEWASGLLGDESVGIELARWILASHQPQRYGAALEAGHRLTGCSESCQAVMAPLAQVCTIEPRSPFDASPSHRMPAETVARLQAARMATGIVMRWADYQRCLGWLRREGYDHLIEAARQLHLPGEQLLTLAEAAFYQQWLHKAIDRHPACWEFERVDHEVARASFARKDGVLLEHYRQEIGERLRRRGEAAPRGIGTGRVSDYTERALIDHEQSKQKRHIPVRELVRRAHRTLLQLMPCWMMGPASVAHFLPPEAAEFDLLVMDEASQIRPEDAIGPALFTRSGG